ncbi:MAG: anti-sigma factor antagonist [Baekduia sp.]|nr:anti-sigma factor antagonist [Baekduia sp.]
MNDYIPDANYKRREESLGGDKMVMELHGELDMFISPGLAARFHELAEDGDRDVVVDLSDARFIDTTVLETFVMAQKELQDHKHALAVIADGPYTRRTFELTGLNDVLRVCGSRDEALSRLA